jgi:DNA-binding CsgD family transcriptional regulator
MSASASGSSITTYVGLRTETFLTNPYGVAMAVAIAVAIALVRFSPIASTAISGGVLACQLLFWPPRFSQTSWIAYVGILLVAIGIGAYGGRIFRWIGLALVAIFNVAVGALLNLPSLSLSGTWGTINGKPWSSGDVVPAFEIYSVVWVGLGVGAWFIGRRMRRSLTTEAATPVADVGSTSFASLSPREREIFMLAARGLSNSAIAVTAHIGESTVKTHLASISSKLGLSSRAELVVFAYESGAVSVPASVSKEAGAPA